MKMAPNCILQYPSGRWGFAGSVHPRLAFVRKDGGTPEARQLWEARQFGPRLAGLKTRSWATEEEARAAAAAIGQPVTDPMKA